MRDLIPLGAWVLMSAVFLHAAWGQMSCPGALNERACPSKRSVALLTAWSGWRVSWWAGLCRPSVQGGRTIMARWCSRRRILALLAAAAVAPLLAACNSSNQNGGNGGGKSWG
jgi:hypothetical protein